VRESEWLDLSHSDPARRRSEPEGRFVNINFTKRTQISRVKSTFLEKNEPKSAPERRFPNRLYAHDGSKSHLFSISRRKPAWKLALQAGDAANYDKSSTPNLEFGPNQSKSDRIRPNPTKSWSRTRASPNLLPATNIEEPKNESTIIPAAKSSRCSSDHRNF
jgi:hypothetical protein